MKNITVSVDDETYRRARIRAAEQDTSVSALVKRFLTELALRESDYERLKREEKELRARIHGFSAGDRMSRDEVHERGR
jgi:plasmid stability protein